MTSHASPAYQRGGKPFINMFESGRLSPRWKDLLLDFPDRFVFSLDNVFSYFWVPEIYLKKMSLWWRSLSELPDEVAHAVAHGNAERLWKLDSKPEDVSMLPPWITEKTMGPVEGTAVKLRR